MAIILLQEFPLLFLLSPFVLQAARQEIAFLVRPDQFHDPLENISRHKRSEEALITKLHTTSNINLRFSDTSVEAIVLNSLSNSSEITFTLQLPEEAFIYNFTMAVNGKIYVAKVLAKDSAEKLYEEAKENKQTAGLVASGRDIERPDRKMTVFSTSVNIEAKARVIFRLTYQELLRRIRGSYEQIISVQLKQIVEDLQVAVSVYEPQGIQWISLRTPLPHYQGLSSGITKIDESDKWTKYYYRPSEDQQQQILNIEDINSNVYLRYDTNPTEANGYVVASSTHFVFFFSPNEQLYEPLPKNIIFVIDISGSMAGKKIQQTKEATVAILPQLREEDRFMIILFDSKLEYWPESRELVTANEENLASAKYFTEKRLNARDSTNINLALVTACNILNAVQREIGSSLVLFLTDGEPSEGVTETEEIVKNVVEAAKEKVSIFALGFGEHLNYRLLEMISYSNKGYPQKIYESSDATSQLENFFQRISSPLLYDIRFTVTTPYISIADVTNLYFPQYFAGSELVLVGKIPETAREDWSIIMTAKSLLAEVKFETQVPLVNQTIDYPQNFEQTSVQDLLQRLFVHFMIKDLIQRSKGTLDEQEKMRLQNQTLDLALGNNLVTPLTSLVIVAEEEKQNGEIPGGLLDESADYSKNFGAVFGGCIHLHQSLQLITLMSLSCHNILF